MDEHVQPLSATRNPPQIIRIPPRSDPPLGYFKWGLILSLSFAAVIGIPVAIAQGQIADTIFGMGAVYIPIAIAGGIGLRIAGVRYRRNYANFMALHGHELVEVSEREARSDWNYSAMGSPADLIRKILKRIPEPTDRARVVCTGFSEPPHVGDLRFEPRFITENDQRWERVAKHAVPAILGVGLILRIMTRPHGPFESALLVVMVFATVYSVLALLLGNVVEANYVRLAPGIVQFMKFSGKGTKAKIRTYRMEAGTTVTVRNQWGVYTFVFGCGEQIDTLQLVGVRNRAEVTNDVWIAILSTAPIPELPEDELLG